jgi:hypothetical protein
VLIEKKELIHQRTLLSSPSFKDKEKKSKTKITDFEILKPISKGGFGKVFLARKKKTKGNLIISIRYFRNQSYHKS